VPAAWARPVPAASTAIMSDARRNIAIPSLGFSLLPRIRLR
jgi:hypothetical protein